MKSNFVRRNLTTHLATVTPVAQRLPAELIIQIVSILTSITRDEKFHPLLQLTLSRVLFQRLKLKDENHYCTMRIRERVMKEIE